MHLSSVGVDSGPTGVHSGLLRMRLLFTDPQRTLRNPTGKASPAPSHAGRITTASNRANAHKHDVLDVIDVTKTPVNCRSQ
jgi:hypothetical protein